MTNLTLGVRVQGAETGNFEEELFLYSCAPVSEGGAYTFDLDLPITDAEAGSRLVASVTQDCVERERKGLLPRQLTSSSWTALTETPSRTNWLGRLFGA